MVFNTIQPVAVTLQSPEVPLMNFLTHGLAFYAASIHGNISSQSFSSLRLVSHQHWMYSIPEQLFSWFQMDLAENVVCPLDSFWALQLGIELPMQMAHALTLKVLFVLRLLACCQLVSLSLCLFHIHTTGITRLVQMMQAHLHLPLPPQFALHRLLFSVTTRCSSLDSNPDVNTLRSMPMLPWHQNLTWLNRSFKPSRLQSSPALSLGWKVTKMTSLNLLNFLSQPNWMSKLTVMLVPFKLSQI